MPYLLSRLESEGCSRIGGNNACFCTYIVRTVQFVRLVQFVQYVQFVHVICIYNMPRCPICIYNMPCLPTGVIVCYRQPGVAAGALEDIVR